MKKSYIVNVTFADMRLDRWIRHNIEKIPQGLIEKNLRNGKIKVNKKKVKSSYKVKLNDSIDTFDLDFKFSKDSLQKKKASKNTIKSNEKFIVDNNDDFIIVNKKSGIPVQGGTKSKNNLIDIFADSKIFINSKPYPVHRLDKDTSGLLIIAKHRKSAQLLTSLFRLRKVHKTYIAICHGEVDKNSGILENNLIRYEDNKPIVEKAKTVFKVLDKNSELSIVEMNPITGRKHQIRKQLLSIGNPIFGDDKYGFKNFKKGKNKNLMLHAFRLKFIINDKKYSYTSSLPEHFINLIKKKRLNFPY